MNEDKKFNKPECEIILFVDDDIITTSGGPGWPGYIDQDHTDDTPFF